MERMENVRPDAERRRLTTGTRVQVRNRLDRRWSSGFEVDVPTDEGYRLRRLSDNAVLPAAFPPTEVRPEQ